MKDDLYQQAKDRVFRELENVLRGNALLLKDSTTASDDEKMAGMRVIEDFIKYIRDYDKNMQLLSGYKDFMERIIDDGR